MGGGIRHRARAKSSHVWTVPSSLSLRMWSWVTGHASLGELRVSEILRTFDPSGEWAEAGVAGLLDLVAWRSNGCATIIANFGGDPSLRPCLLFRPVWRRLEGQYLAGHGRRRAACFIGRPSQSGSLTGQNLARRRSCDWGARPSWAHPLGTLPSRHPWSAYARLNGPSCWPAQTAIGGRLVLWPVIDGVQIDAGGRSQRWPWHAATRCP